MFKIIFALPTSHWDGVSIIQECIKAPTKFPMTTLEQTFTLHLINNTLHCLHLDFTAAWCVPTWNPLLTVSVPNGSDCWEHHVSYLLDGFQCGDCGERCGSHFSNVHIHITAVFADSQHGIFFRNVFGLLDIFRALFNLRLAVHNCVCHCIRVISILLLERRGGNKSRFWIELKLIPLASPSCSLG